MTVSTTPARSPASTHSQTSASSPLIMIERTILIDEATPTGPREICGFIARPASVAAAARVWPADQERRKMQLRMHRRHHRDVDITRARRFDIGPRAGLGLRRAGIAVEEKRATLEAGRAASAASRALSGVTKENTASASATASGGVVAPITRAGA